MIETADLDWDETGAPCSRRFGDVYFSRSDGLAESRAVFLEGCGLPGAWAGRRRFVVGELGFGTGLNILALLDLWRRHRPSGGRLHVFSVEAFPLSASEAARALSAWPELADLARMLTSAWPRRARGFHRIDFPGLDAVLDLAVLEAADALEAWSGRADAWFLDGFSPARNPEMWREDVLALVAARSAPGARAATFTVAGSVRRGLEAQGFSVAKRPGFGRKAERLEAVFEGGGAWAPPERTPARVCIIGAGIAGAALARAFRAEGLDAVVVDAAGPGAGASGNPAALVTPRLDAGGGLVAALHAEAFGRAVDLYERETAAAIIARGALQLEAKPRDAARFDTVVGSDLFAPGALARLAPAEVADRVSCGTDRGGLFIRDGLVIEPKPALDAWLAGCETVTARVSALEPTAHGWRLVGDAGATVCDADIVCLAAGFGSAALAQGLALQPVRGQASIAAGLEPQAPAAWGGYVIPTRDGLLFGATHDRGDDGEDVRDPDHRRNLDLLAQTRPDLAEALSGRALDGRAGVRAATPDHLPLAGPLGPNLFVLTGLGGRGFALAPLLAEHIAALALGGPSPLPNALASAVRPDRFSSRSA